MKRNKLRSAFIAFLCVIFTLCIFTVSTVAASLPKVKKVKATAEYSKVTVSWQKQSGASGYQLYQYNSKTKKWKKLNNYKTNKVTVSSLSPATTYTFKVRAYKKTSSGIVYSAYSDKMSVKTKLKKVSKPTVKAGSNYADISWSKTKNAEGYQVEFYDSSKKAWVRKKTVSKNKVTIKELSSVKSYKIRIRAYNKSNKKTVYSPYSDSVSFTTLPGTVTSLKTTEVGSKTVKLSWKKVSKATGYQVYVNEYSNGKATSYKLNKTVKTNSVSLSLNSCKHHRFRVRAYYENSKGKKLYGAYATSSLVLTLPAKVTSLKQSSVTNSSVKLTWKGDKNATGYYIYQQQSGASSKLVATLASDKTSYTAKSLKQLTSYKFSVKTYHTYKGKTKTSSAVSISVKTDDNKVDSIAFTQKKSSMGIGETYTFKASVSPSYAANKSITWSSSKKSVATVSSKGVVTAVSPGTAYITAKSADGGFTVKAKLTVKPVKSTAVSLPSQISLYVNESVTLNPTFTPSNTTDKSFTVTGKDYTYKTKGFLGIGSKTETCKFSDYITIDSNGRLIAKKLTVEPETANKFSFTITVTAKDSGVTGTAKVNVIDRTLKVTYDREDNPWYYGNSARLTAHVSNGASFKAEDVVWKTSNKNIATVSADGTVKCVGVGAVTISALSPDGKEKFDYQIYCTGTVKVEKTYFENCTAGESYKITAQFMPSGSNGSVFYTSMNPDVVSVDSQGNVKILKKGTGAIAVTTANNYNIEKIVFTTGKWEKPDTDAQSLFNHTKNQLNSIKKTMPSLSRSDSSVFTEFAISDKSSKLTAKDFEDIFDDFAKETTKLIDEVDTSSATMAQMATYYANVPVAAGQSIAVVEGIDVANDVKSVELIDNGSYTYDIKLVLKEEYIPDAQSATMATAHGKIFDILSSQHLADIDRELTSSSVSVKYSSFAQKYHDSSVTVTINKATGLIERAVYDMNIDITITGLEMTMSFMSMFNSDLSFSVNNRVAIDVIR